MYHNTITSPTSTNVKTTTSPVCTTIQSPDLQLLLYRQPTQLHLPLHRQPLTLQLTTAHTITSPSSLPLLRNHLIYICSHLGYIYNWHCFLFIMEATTHMQTTPMSADSNTDIFISNPPTDIATTFSSTKPITTLDTSTTTTSQTSSLSTDTSSVDTTSSGETRKVEYSETNKTYWSRIV